MRNFFLRFTAVVIASLSLSFAIASAEEPAKPAAAAQDDPKIDRDGKRICGWSVMNDSERAGYRNIMHKTPALADREEIRVDHCARMRARAKEKGVPVDE